MRILPSSFLLLAAVACLTITLSTARQDIYIEEKARLASHLSKAEDRLKSRDFDAAVRSFSQAIDIDPGRASSFYGRGTSYLAQRRHISALNDFEKCLELDPEFQAARLQRAYIYGDRGEYDLALQDIDVFTQRNPSHEKAKELRETFLEGKNLVAKAHETVKALRYEEALPLLQKVIQTSPGDTKTRLYIVRAYMNGNEFNQAHHHLLRLVNQYQQGELYLMLAHIQYLYFAEYERARMTLKQCLESDPEDKACKSFFKAIKKIQKSIDEAGKMVKELQLVEAMELALDMNNPSSIMRQATALSEEGVVLFDQQFVIPNIGIEAILYKLACHCVAKLKKRDHQYRSCERAAELLPEDPEVLINAAQISIQRDDVEQTLQYLQDAQTHLNDHPKRETLRRRIRELHEEALLVRKRKKTKDYYAILQVPRDASAKQIKKSFRKLAKEYHPDRVKRKGYKGGLTPEEAQKKMVDLNEAYGVLQDEEQRSKYDSGELHQDQGGGQAFYGGGFGHGFDQHIFKMFHRFGPQKGGRGTGGERQGSQFHWEGFF